MPANTTGPFWAAKVFSTLTEAARHVVGLADADSAENNPPAQNIMIYPVACEAPAQAANGPPLSRRIGAIRLRPGSVLESLYQTDTVAEEFCLNFETPNEYCMMEGGIPALARGTSGEIRAVESPDHKRFFF